MTDKTQPVRTREEHATALAKAVFDVENPSPLLVSLMRKELAEAEQRGYQKRAGEEVKSLKDFVTGVSVSIDISTGEHDAGNRLFGIVNEVQGADGTKEDMTLLVQEPKPNFKTQESKASAKARGEYILCASCMGSGEGIAYGVCYDCKGSGVEE